MSDKSGFWAWLAKKVWNFITIIRKDSGSQFFFGLAIVIFALIFTQVFSIYSIFGVAIGILIQVHAWYQKEGSK